MDLWKCVTVVVVVVMCVSLEKVATQHITGRCCAARKDRDGGGCAQIGTKFSPELLVEQNVSWVAHDLDCPSTHTVAYYDLNTTTFTELVQEDDELLLSFWLGDTFPKRTREYCIEAHGEGYRGALCQPDPHKMCGNAVCIPKCCGDGEELQDYMCVTSGNGSIFLPFYSFLGKPIPAPPNVVIVEDMTPSCEGRFPSPIEDINEIYLLVNGKLLEHEAQIVHQFSHYCIENSVMDGDHSPMIIVCSETENMIIVVKHYLQKVGYIISIVFLMVTIIFHLCIKSLQDTQGLCLVSHMVSMVLVDIFLFILSISSYGMSTEFCLFSAFVLHFSFLAMFFWLNIMCFDIWRVIRATVKGIPLLRILNDDAKKFRLFSLYGWGVPLVVVVVAAVLHFLPEEQAKSITPPGFGVETCWLSGDMELLIYCYAYVAALFILDLIFLGHTMYMLYKAGGACACFRNVNSLTAFNPNHLGAFWQRFTLFIFMVLTWTTEIISWKVPPKELWIVSDFINSLQGFFVFLIFMSSRKRRTVVIVFLKKCLGLHTPTNHATTSHLAAQTMRNLQIAQETSCTTSKTELPATETT